MLVTEPLIKFDHRLKPLRPLCTTYQIFSDLGFITQLPIHEFYRFIVLYAFYYFSLSFSYIWRSRVFNWNKNYRLFFLLQIFAEKFCIGENETRKELQK